MIGEIDPYNTITGRVSPYFPFLSILFLFVLCPELYPFYNLHFQEQNHIRAFGVFMTVIMVTSVLSSLAIVRRILMATSVLKVDIVKIFLENQQLKVFFLFDFILNINHL